MKKLRELEEQMRKAGRAAREAHPKIERTN